MALNTHPYVPSNQQNEELWANGIPSYKEDNSRNYRQYVDRIAKRVDTLIKEGTGGDGPNWSWVKNDGKSHFHITIDDEERKYQQFTFKVPSGSIDWGDGTVEELTETENTLHEHTYSQLGNYDVTVDGLYMIDAPVLGTFAYASEDRWTSLKKLELYLQDDDGAIIKNDAFTNCHGLEEVCISGTPDVLKCEHKAFANCYELKYVKFLKPTKIVWHTNNVGFFESCWVLESIECDGFLRLGDNTNQNLSGVSILKDCHNLSSLPEDTRWNYMGGGTASQRCFSNNFKLRDLNLKSDRTDTGVGKYGAQTMGDIHNLRTFTLDPRVSSILANAFPGVRYSEAFIPNATPPTMGAASAFPHIDPDAIIHIPVGSLEAYQAATNWAEYADFFVDDIEV